MGYFGPQHTWLRNPRDRRAYRVRFADDKNFDDLDFDATSNLGPSGLFWSRSDDPQEHNRIFTYLDSVSDEQWEHDSGWIRDQLMVYDYGNTKIRTYVEGVLADSLENKQVTNN